MVGESPGSYGKYGNCDRFFPHHLRCAHGRYGMCTGQGPLGVRWRLGRREFGATYQNERRLEDPTLDYAGIVAFAFWRHCSRRRRNKIAHRLPPRLLWERKPAAPLAG
jgi:hypothetical protein